MPQMTGLTRHYLPAVIVTGVVQVAVLPLPSVAVAVITELPTFMFAVSAAWFVKVVAPVDEYLTVTTPQSS